MTKFVERQLAGKTFLVVDPSKYPYGDYQFEDELDVKARWWRDIKPGEVIVDVGASWGGYTLPALAQGATVISYEPSIVERPVLKAAVDENGFESRSHVVNALLGDGEPVPEWFRKVVFLNFQIEESTHATTLDHDYALFSAFVKGRVARVKMDVEGAEQAVLRGGEKLFREHRPLVLVEDHTTTQFPGLADNGDRCVEILRSFGYERVEKFQPERGNPFVVAYGSEK